MEFTDELHRPFVDTATQPGADQVTGFDVNILLFNPPEPHPCTCGKILFLAQFSHPGSSVGFLVAMVKQDGTHFFKVDGLRDPWPIGSNAHVEMPNKQRVFHWSPPMLHLPGSILCQDLPGPWRNLSSRQWRPQDCPPVPQGCRCGTAIVLHEFVSNHCIDAIAQGSPCPTRSLAPQELGVEDTRIDVDAAFRYCRIPCWSAVPTPHEMLEAECRPIFSIINDPDLTWTNPEFLHPPAHVAFEDRVGSPFGVELGEVTLEVLSPVVGPHSPSESLGARARAVRDRRSSLALLAVRSPTHSPVKAPNPTSVPFSSSSSIFCPGASLSKASRPVLTPLSSAKTL